MPEITVSSRCPYPAHGSEEGVSGSMGIREGPPGGWALEIAGLAFAGIAQKGTLGGGYRQGKGPEAGQQGACVENSKASGWLELRMSEGLQRGVWKVAFHPCMCVCACERERVYSAMDPPLTCPVFVCSVPALPSPLLPPCSPFASPLSLPLTGAPWVTETETSPCSDR